MTPATPNLLIRALFSLSMQSSTPAISTNPSNHSAFIVCSLLDPATISVCVNAAVQRRVQHLDLNLYSNSSINLSSVFSCRTLVVLRLQWLDLNQFSSVVDLPFLKVLHLQDLYFSEREYLAELLEDLKVSGLSFGNYVTDREFKTLPKLVRADISVIHTCFLLMVVNNVEFLHLDEIYFRLYETQWMYSNTLTHVELVYRYYNPDWSQVAELLSHCPKLQVLVINQPSDPPSSLSLKNWKK